MTEFYLLMLLYVECSFSRRYRSASRVLALWRTYQQGKGEGTPTSYWESGSAKILKCTGCLFLIPSYKWRCWRISSSRRGKSCVRTVGCFLNNFQNLRRWEIAERQRRKAARESSAVGGVSRRATLLWQGKKSKIPPIGGLGAHTALQSRDNIDNIDILPLRDINTSPTPSTSRSDSEDGHTVDPFANPSDALSPFSDAHQFEQPEVIPVSYENETPVSVYTNSPKASHPPPPKPLSLPPPRIFPPAAIMTPISQSNTTYEDSNEHISQDTRWWHEWLCRCGEGPDRGGDNQVQAQLTWRDVLVWLFFSAQAGRTNPFE